jgi:glycosyltransferase involved in cell wall biosynthesis
MSRIPSHSQAPERNHAAMTATARFDAGDYVGVAQLGDAGDWRTYASLGLIGKKDEAIAGLDRFNGEAPRFYSAVAHWIDGDENEAIRLLTPLTLPHARNLLALIRKDVIRVLTQWPTRAQWPQDLLGAVRYDPKFEVRNVSFDPDDTRNRPGADARTWVDSRTPPDFYNCLTAEWHVIAPNLRQLPCPILAATADYDAHIQTILPWLRQFDELIVTSRTEWDDVNPLSEAPVSTFPKLVGVAEALPPLKGLERRSDVFFSGTVQHPFHPDKTRLLQQVMELSDLNINVINGFVGVDEYLHLLSDSRVCYTFVRHPGAMPTRGLEALSMGCALVIQRECVLGLWAGEREGVLTYDLDAGDLPAALRHIVADWPTFAARAQRGAEIIRREFRVPRIVSQYLRFLTFLAARPRERGEAPPIPLVQKRKTMWRDWTPRDPEIRRQMLANALNRAMPHLDGEKRPALSVYLDAARELTLEYGAQTQDEQQKKNPDRSLVDAALNLYQQGVTAYPRSLVMRFNAIRVGIHYGNSKQQEAARALLLQTLNVRANDWQLDSMDDVFSWDYFPEEFNLRGYIDRIMAQLKTGRAIETELRSLILASLWNYRAQHEPDGRAAFGKAFELDPEFAVYGLRYARALLQFGNEAERTVAAALLGQLADGTPVCMEAFNLLAPLVRAGAECPRFPQLQQAQAHMRAGLGRGGESWQMAEADGATLACEDANTATVTRSGPPRDYKISAIVPIYNAERFIRGLLEDLEAQTVADQLEIVICNTGSPQDEGTVIAEFMARYDNITYITTPSRENSHEAANRCIAAASGAYLTLACVDDRHRPDALEIMARTLDAYPNTGLVYADSLITRRANETWAANTAHSVFRWPEFSLRQALMYSCFGPQPMWRRELHASCGVCDPTLLVAGDYDLFLRLAIHGGARHIPETLGLFLEGGNAMRHQEAGSKETLQIVARYRAQLPLTRLYPDLAQFGGSGLQSAGAPTHGQKLAEAACWIDYGRLALMASCPDVAHAIVCFEQARERLGANPVVLNNLALAHAIQGDVQQALSLLEPLARGGNAEARHNLAQIRNSRGEMCDLRVGTLMHRALANLPPLLPPAGVRQPWNSPSAATANVSSAAELRARAVEKPDGFSFVVITAGQRPHLLQLVLRSIRAQQIENSEILVVGRHFDEQGITYLPAAHAAEQCRRGEMRNVGMQAARYRRIVFLDDDCLLAPDWYRSLQHAPTDFDILTMQIRLPDGTRYWDLVSSGGERGHRLLLPEEAAQDASIYATSGAMMIGAHVAQAILWNDDMVFGEDVEFSRRCQAVGCTLTHWAEAVVYHADATYTSIGRWCLRRQQGRTQQWVKSALSRLSAQEIFVQGAAHLGHDRTAEGADCFRYGLLLYPNYDLFRTALAAIEELSGGHLPGIAWHPDGDPAYHTAMNLYRSSAWTEQGEDQQETAEMDAGRAVVGGPAIAGTPGLTLSPLAVGAELLKATRPLNSYDTQQVQARPPHEIESWLHALEAAGAAITVTPTRQEQEIGAMPVALKAQIVARLGRPDAGAIHISALPPPHFARQAGARANIGLAQFPTDGLPSAWVEACNRMDAIWTPTEFNRQTFMRAGVQADKLSAIPTGLVMSHWEREVKPLPIQGARGFNFLCLLDWSRSSGWDILVRAFVREFSDQDDVALILKIASRNRLSMEQITEQAVRQIRMAARGNTDQIPTLILDDAPVPAENRPNLYRSVDCLVQPARGGDCIAACLEAMAMGLPAIATNWGGFSEFLTHANGYPLDCRVMNVLEEAARERPELRGQRWAEPNEGHLRTLLRQAFTQRQKAQQLGAQARLDIAERFDYRVVAATVAAELARYPARVAALVGGGAQVQEAPAQRVAFELLLP